MTGLLQVVVQRVNFFFSDNGGGWARQALHRAAVGDDDFHGTIMMAWASR